MRIFRVSCLLLLCVSLQAFGKNVVISLQELQNKIKGGWAGQVIGCTYGGPTEFKYVGRYIPDEVSLDYRQGSMKELFDSSPGLYDDIYMDLTFVEVLDSKGLDATANDFALAFANADYPLWHANQAARNNILHGIMPPMSGHWTNNPHANDIDFQIESDFIGLMCPGMPRTANSYADKVGHIMNYGEGWYGGVFVANLYAQAFLSSDPEIVVTNAMASIPQSTVFHDCIKNVLWWRRLHPLDWRKTWKLCQEYYVKDKVCPEGVLSDYDIDAIINSAYVAIGLLYGKGDFNQAIDIATRCGQDSDCNPATVGGIMGVMLGYDQIPTEWRKEVFQIEERPFPFTNLSLNKACESSFRHAKDLVLRNGGKIKGEDLVISLQNPKAVPVEDCFSKLVLSSFEDFKALPIQEFDYHRFSAKAIVVCGDVKSEDPKYVAQVSVMLDDKEVQVVDLPIAFHDRRQEMYFNLNVPAGSHVLTMKWLNPTPGAEVLLLNVAEYR